MSTSTQPGLGRAMVPAIINAVINGTAAYSVHRDRASVPLTVDAISSTEATVGSEAAMIALTLAVVLTSITALVARKEQSGQGAGNRTRRFFPTVPLIALQNALMLFGVTVAAAVLWQRAAGTVKVSPLTAALLVAVFAGVATVVIHVRTTAAMSQT